MNTNTKRHCSIIISAGVLAAMTWIRPASAETMNCMEITSVPTTITTQGVYCLKQNLSTNLATGNAITVNVNNVTIDCNDYKLGNLAAGPSTQANGISANSRINTIVRHCGIRGFRNGVSLIDGESRVDDNRFDNNTQAAIVVTGSGSAIRRNEIVDTGGSTAGGQFVTKAIYASGGMDVIDNTVSGVASTNGSNGDVYGIYAEDMDAGTIRGNRVRELAPDGSGFRRGIWVDSGNRVTVKSNSVVLNGGLLTLDAGIRCGDGLILNGIAQDNAVLGTGVVSTALGLINCTNLGGVNYVNPL